MCDKTATALETLLAQPDRGGLTEASALVFKQVVKDTQKMEKRMTTLEQTVVETKDRVTAIEGDVKDLHSKLDKVIAYMESPSWIKRFWDAYGNKIVLFALILGAAILTKYAVPELVDLWKALV